MNRYLPCNILTPHAVRSLPHYLRTAIALPAVLLAISSAETAAGPGGPRSGDVPHRIAHPFFFEMDSNNTAHFCGPTLLCIDALGTAEIPHLGKSTAAYEGTLDFAMTDPSTGCASNPATLTITAANGDMLVLLMGGQHCPSGPGAPLGVTSGDYTVSGGTGRFEGATGGGTYGDVNTSQNADFTGTDTSQFEGVLSY